MTARRRSDRATASGDELAAFTRTHAVWDPMPLWDGQRHLLYVLAMPRDLASEQGGFFTRGNAIHAFVSPDLRNWRHLGVAFGPRTAEERLCAGNPVFHAGRYWFFGSATVETVDEQHLDQRLFLAVSDDGLHFTGVPQFRLEPDPGICPHNRYHPRDGHMLFAWRDPWPLYDPQSDRHYLYVCAGGERWGCDPQVILAWAPRLAGSYTLVGPVLELPRDGATGRPTLGEVERVNVTRHGDRYYMTFSCWPYLVDSRVLARYAAFDGAPTDGSVYVATADSPAGPFRFGRACPAVVPGSSRAGLYGTTFLAGPGALSSMGWQPGSFTVDPERSARLRFVQLRGCRGAFPAMRWPPRLRLRFLLAPLLHRLDRRWPRLAGPLRRLIGRHAESRDA